MSSTDSLGSMAIEAAEIFRPPERLLIREAAAKYRTLYNAGAYIGPWLDANTPYMMEPQDVLSDREHEAVVFCGPAQCGKTDIFLNWLTWNVCCDPMDMILYQTSNVQARDFSMRRVDRLHRHSEHVRKRLRPGQGDNTFDKQYTSGAILTLSWPSIAELSGRPIGRVGLTDYDRMPENVDGEGSPFDLARKRTTTFGSSKKTFAESSPGFEVLDPKWQKQSPHQAPPTRGILSLYNRGDRRRWYWKCPHCGLWEEPSFARIRYPESKDPMESAEAAWMLCSHNGCVITPNQRYDINLRGRWLRDGQTIGEDDVVRGDGVRSDIASFWLKGPAATFLPWRDLVLRYLNALSEFHTTGTQETLKATVNTDQGEPYTTRGQEAAREPEQMKEASKDTPKGEVPTWVRFLIAQVDVQKSKFVVQVHGIGPGDNGFNIAVVDRFDIQKSKRLDDDGEHYFVKPGAFPEDWDMIHETVFDREYKIVDKDMVMSVSHISCDSGGREGVTTNAYDWWLRLRDNAEGLHHRVRLLKGDTVMFDHQGSPRETKPRARISFPDSQRKDRKAKARGEVPVMMLNVNVLKDSLQTLIERALVDGDRLEWPTWLDDSWFMEMCSEIRGEKGWENPRRVRNEAWDLLVYCLGWCALNKVERFDWDAPLAYAQVHELNEYVRATTVEKQENRSLKKPIYASAKHFAEMLA